MAKTTSSSRFLIVGVAALVVVAVLAGAYAAGIIGRNGPELCGLTKSYAVDLPNVSGRIDHMAYDPASGKLYVAAFTNNTLAVVDVTARTFERSVSGFSEPQGLVLVPSSGELYVSNGGTGTVDVLSAATLQRVANVSLGSDADNLRFDPGTNLVYAGYGEGGIASINITSHQVEGRLTLAGHPEGFQIASSTVYLNVPTSGYVAVGNLTSGVVLERWPILSASGNYPMAIDASGKTLLVGVRSPPLLMSVSASDGRPVANQSVGQDPDDVYSDSVNGCVYVSSGSGVVSTFHESSSGTLQNGVQISTSPGARTSFLAAEQGLLFVAAPASGTDQAKILVYSLT